MFGPISPACASSPNLAQRHSRRRIPPKHTILPAPPLRRPNAAVSGRATTSDHRLSLSLSPLLPRASPPPSGLPARAGAADQSPPPSVLLLRAIPSCSGAAISSDCPRCLVPSPPPTSPFLEFVGCRR
ncbi:hypothetical protein DAI22_12g142000 [Oryza sativa Japonica Group]|nr:hypothetical protein DAI22_12g142000 [Oryza sativa Japonica Group]